MDLISQLEAATKEQRALNESRTLFIDVALYKALREKYIPHEPDLGGVEWRTDKLYVVKPRIRKFKLKRKMASTSEAERTCE